MRLFCQIVVGLFWVVSMFASLRDDFKGKPAREAYGFSGGVITIVTFALGLLLLYGAGAFSELRR